MSKTEEQSRAEARIIAEEAEKVKEEKAEAENQKAGQGCLVFIAIVLIYQLVKWLLGLMA